MTSADLRRALRFSDPEHARALMNQAEGMVRGAVCELGSVAIPARLEVMAELEIITRLARLPKREGT